MDAAVVFLSGLRRRGFTVAVAPGGDLDIGPADRLTEADREALRRHKPALVALLNAPRVADCGCVTWPDGVVWGRRACREHGGYGTGWGIEEGGDGG